MLTIAIYQMNPTLGDLPGNRDKILHAYEKAVSMGADLLVAPEMALSGFPLGPLAGNSRFIADLGVIRDEIADNVIRSGHKTALLFGSPTHGPDGRIYNSAAFVDPEGGATHLVHKMTPPASGSGGDIENLALASSSDPVQWRGRSLGIIINDDGWTPRVAAHLKDAGADVLLWLNASTFSLNGRSARRAAAADRIAETCLPLIYCNLVGGQDEHVFDGDSFAYDGRSYGETDAFQEGIFTYSADLSSGPVTMTKWPQPGDDAIGSAYRAMVLGFADYTAKLGFPGTVLGMSGGIDAALAATIAVDALGPQNVHLVSMPSRFTPKASINDASKMAQILGCPMRTIAIEPAVKAFRVAYAGANINNGYSDVDIMDGPWGTGLAGAAEENLQSRVRGVLLMAVSNQEDLLVASAANKTDLAIGYVTAHGDTGCGFNLLKDVYKTEIYRLCEWRNALSDRAVETYGFKGPPGLCVPSSIVTKAASPELAPDQQDSDRLPAADILDDLLKCLLEEQAGPERAISQGFHVDDVLRVQQMILQSEHKRRIAAPGIRLRPNDGFERMPIVSAYRR